MMSATLFGLATLPLVTAIAEVESDRGAISRNIFQIRDIYIDDVNRIYGTDFKHSAKFDERQSVHLMEYYWRWYGHRYELETKHPVTYEVLARIHNGGPRGWEKPATLSYWLRVKAAMERNAKKEKEANKKKRRTAK